MGGDGNDVLVGDLISLGETGNDTMIGGDGADILLGGAGDDSLMAGSGVSGGAAPGDLEWLIGGAGNDTVIGSSGRDIIWEQLDAGEGGNDSVLGGDGNDLILTGQGNDTLVGGNGDDDLYGGDGTDRFVFGANWGRDVVWDWSNGELFVLTGSGVSSFSQLTITEGFLGSVNVSFGTNNILVLGASGLIDASDFVF
jgi:Ca2+-binding RTX toxin-like protein